MGTPVNANVAHAAPWASLRLGLLRKQLGDAEGAAAAFERAAASGHTDAAPLATLNLRVCNQGNGQAGGRECRGRGQAGRPRGGR